MGCTASSVKRGGGASDDANDNVFPAPVRTDAQRESAAADQEDAATAPNPVAQQADQQTSSTSSAASHAAAT